MQPQCICTNAQPTAGIFAWFHISAWVSAKSQSMQDMHVAPLPAGHHPGNKLQDVNRCAVHSLQHGMHARHACTVIIWHKVPDAFNLVWTPYTSLRTCIMGSFRTACCAACIRYLVLPTCPTCLLFKKQSTNSFLVTARLMHVAILLSTLQARASGEAWTWLTCPQLPPSLWWAAASMSSCAHHHNNSRRHSQPHDGQPTSQV